ncbi:MAG: hypothetical protein ABIJ72_00415 [bacterium]
MPDTHIYLSKIDAAKRQLEMAIQLFFHYSDIVSIHALTWNSYKILKDLATTCQIKSYHEQILDNIKKERKSEIRKKFSEAGNFMKHADKDPSNVLKFNTSLTEFWIWDSCELYRKYVKDNPPMILLFISWFGLQHYDLFLEGEYKETAKRLKSSLNPNDRVSFYKHLSDIKSF